MQILTRHKVLKAKQGAISVQLFSQHQDTGNEYVFRSATSKCWSWFVQVSVPRQQCSRSVENVQLPPAFGGSGSANWKLNSRTCNCVERNALLIV